MSTVAERKCRLCGATVPARSTFCSRCGAAADKSANNEKEDLADQVRTLFAGDIAIEREVGRGSMAVVYLGFDLELERRLAIKVLLPDVAGDAEIADRFKREAKLVAALNHPNVIPIHGVRNSPAVSAIVMQFVEGNSLDVVLRERAGSPLPLPLAALVLSQVAAGLEHAHTRGVIHRDVKPANVLLDPAGHVVVSDFGIARRHGGTTVTGSGVLLGTAAYMSPEQCRGRRAEAAADQYALGVVAFELLAGRRPFIGRSSDVIRAHLTEAPPRLSELRPDVAPEIESFVMRMLEKDPAARHPSLRDAERLFRRFVIDESATTTQLKQVSLPKATEASRADIPGLEHAKPVASFGEPSSRSNPRPIGLLVAAVGLVALLAAGAIMLRPSPSVSARSEHAATASATMPPEASATKPTPVPDRPAVRPTTTAEPRKKAMEAQQIAGIEKTSTPVADSAVRVDTSAAVIRPQGEMQSKALLAAPSVAATGAATAAATDAATGADARAVASEFLTWCNHRQWQDVEGLASLDGSADLRTQLINLIRRAPDFQAGFERLASRPVSSDSAFTTEFILDLEWRGGARQFHVTVRAQRSNGMWHVAGFGVHQPD